MNTTQLPPVYRPPTQQQSLFGGAVGVNSVLSRAASQKAIEAPMTAQQTSLEGLRKYADASIQKQEQQTRQLSQQDKELRAQRQVIDRQGVELCDERRKNAELEGQLQEDRKQLQRLEQDMGMYSGLQNIMLADLGKAKSKLQETDELRQQLLHQVQEQEAAVEAIRDAFDHVEAAKSDLDQQLRTELQHKSDLEGELGKTRDALVDKAAALQSVQEELGKLSAAHQELDEASRGLKGQLAESERARADEAQQARQEVETLTARNEQLRDALLVEIQRLQAEHQALTTRSAGLAADLDAAQSRITALEAKAEADAAEHAAKLSSLEQQLSEERAGAEGLRGQAAFQQAAHEAALQLERGLKDVATLRVTELQQAHAAQQAETDELRQALQRGTADKVALEEASSKLAEDLHKKQDALAAMSKRAKDVEDDLAKKLTSLNQRAASEIDTINRKLKASEDTAKTLSAKVSELKAAEADALKELDALRASCAKLEQEQDVQRAVHEAAVAALNAAAAEAAAVAAAKLAKTTALLSSTRSDNADQVAKLLEVERQGAEATARLKDELQQAQSLLSAEREALAVAERCHAEECEKERAGMAAAVAAHQAAEAESAAKQKALESSLLSCQLTVTELRIAAEVAAREAAARLAESQEQYHSSTAAAEAVLHERDAQLDDVRRRLQLAAEAHQGLQEKVEAIQDERDTLAAQLQEKTKLLGMLATAAQHCAGQPVGQAGHGGGGSGRKQGAVEDPVRESPAAKQQQQHMNKQVLAKSVKANAIPEPPLFSSMPASQSAFGITPVRTYGNEPSVPATAAFAVPPAPSQRGAVATTAKAAGNNTWAQQKLAKEVPLPAAKEVPVPVAKADPAPPAQPSRSHLPQPSASAQPSYSRRMPTASGKPSLFAGMHAQTASQAPAGEAEVNSGNQRKKTTSNRRGAAAKKQSANQHLLTDASANASAAMDIFGDIFG